MWRWKRRGELSGSVPTRAGEGRRASWATVAHAEMELAGDEGAWRAEPDTDAEQLCSCGCAAGEWV